MTLQLHLFIFPNVSSRILLCLCSESFDKKYLQEVWICGCRLWSCWALMASLDFWCLIFLWFPPFKWKQQKSQNTQSWRRSQCSQGEVEQTSVKLLLAAPAKEENCPTQVWLCLGAFLPSMPSCSLQCSSVIPGKSQSQSFHEASTELP